MSTSSPPLSGVTASRATWRDSMGHRICSYPSKSKPRNVGSREQALCKVSIAQGRVVSIGTAASSVSTGCFTANEEAWVHVNIRHVKHLQIFAILCRLTNVFVVRRWRGALAAEPSIQISLIEIPGAGSEQLEVEDQRRCCKCTEHQCCWPNRNRRS